MRRFIVSVAFAAMLAAPANAQDQAAQPQPPTAEQARQAARTFGVVMAGMRSEEVPPPVKQALLGCFYNNPLKMISEQAAKLLDANKIAEASTDQLFAAVAAVCGVRPPDAPSE